VEVKTENYRRVTRLKDDKFSVDQLHNYNLLLQVGLNSFEFFVTDPRNNQCLLLEEFKYADIVDYSSLTEVLLRIFDNHHILMAGFWNSVKLSIKNRVFTQVPADYFDKNSLSTYLSLNARYDREKTYLSYYKHNLTDTITVFGIPKNLFDWVDSLYKNKNVSLLHQSCGFIEGVLKNNDHPNQKTMFQLFDGGTLHILITSNKKMLYYNQFSGDTQDFLKYTLLVMKGMKLNQETSKVLLWGDIDQESPFFNELYQYIRNISFGNLRTYLKYNYVFDEIHDQEYFDLFGLYLCD